MTLRTALFVTVVTLSHAPLWAQAKPNDPAEPIVLAGLFTLRPDGEFGGAAAQDGRSVGADLGGTVYMMPCSGIGASNPDRPVSASATEVWRMSGTVLALSADQASVQIGWQRLRRGGQNETSAPQSITLFLKRGERTTLEQIDVPAVDSCPARAALLQVAFASMPELLQGVRSDAKKLTGSGASGGSSSSVRVFSGSQGDLKSTAVALPDQPVPTTLIADLWLVRSAPGRADETAHVTSTVMPIPQQFRFAPITIQTSAGVLNVRVEGTVEVGSTAAGERRFYFSANRTVGFAPANRPSRDGAPLVEGSTKTTVPLPGPDAVLSFEMPALRIPGGETLPDRLSIRVRLTAVAMRDVTPRK